MSVENDFDASPVPASGQELSELANEQLAGERHTSMDGIVWYCMACINRPCLILPVNVSLPGNSH